MTDPKKQCFLCPVYLGGPKIVIFPLSAGIRQNEKTQKITIFSKKQPHEAKK